MIPRTGVIAGAGPLAQWLVDHDPETVLIRFAEFAGAAHGPAQIEARLDAREALRADLYRHAVRDIVFAGPFLRRDDAADLMEWLSEAGYPVHAPGDYAPSLHLPSGTVFGRPGTPAERQAAIIGLEALSDMPGATAVVASGAAVLATDLATNMNDMIDGLTGDGAGAVLAIAPGPGQDPRLAQPAIGPDLADRLGRARLAGAFVAAAGVAVTNADTLRDRIAAHGLFFEAR